MLAAIFLGEKFTKIHTGSLILAIGGLILVSHPDFIFGEPPDEKKNINLMGNY